MLEDLLHDAIQSCSLCHSTSAATSAGATLASAAAAAEMLNSRVGNVTTTGVSFETSLKQTLDRAGKAMADVFLKNLSPQVGCECE